MGISECNFHEQIVFGPEQVIEPHTLYEQLIKSLERGCPGVQLGYGA